MNKDANATKQEREQNQTKRSRKQFLETIIDTA